MFDLQSGNNVGGYTLIDRLGGGAMGSVWRVRDDGGNQYAMKILRSCVSVNPNDEEDADQACARLRLKREALALQRIHHAGVCGIVDMELDASIAFIVTELIEGRNLREDVAENGPYVADDLERLTYKLIEAVKAVHQAGIIHRDIKPTNVMIAATGPVLVDFGIAMGTDESHVTRTGLVMGTPGFIAPEIIEGGDSDELTDWWSLAAVLAFAATGKPVFGTKPLMAVLERAASGNADLSGLPPKTMAAFRSALHPIRQQRCSLSVLANAISDDAMNPLSWPEASRPFDQISCVATRTMWRETACETACETNRETLQGQTVILKQNASSDVKRTVDMNNETMLSTVPMRSTTVMPQLPQQCGEQEYDTHIAELFSEETEPFNQQDLEQNNIGKASESSHTSSQYAYKYRGMWALICCVAVCAVTACINVLDAAGLIIAIMWISATAGYNIAACLYRQQLNGGIIPQHDAVMRIAALPWHAICGLLYALPRVVVIAIASLMGAAAYPLLLGSSPELQILKLGSLHIPFPTYSPSILSQTAIGYAIGCIAAWVILAITKNTDKFCLGLGALLGAGKSSEK